MKILKIIFVIIFITPHIYTYADEQMGNVIKNNIQLPLNLLPEGFKNISFGISIEDFLKARKKAKPEDNTLWDMMARADGKETSYDKFGLIKGSGSYEEKIKHSPFELTKYSFDNYYLREFSFYYISKNVKKVLERRKIIIKELIRLWGAPNELAVYKTFGSDFKREFWNAMLIWNFGNGQVQFWCPQNIEKDIIKKKLDPLLLIMGFGIEMRLRIMELKDVESDEKFWKRLKIKSKPVAIKDLKTADREIQQVFKDIELEEIIQDIKKTKIR